MNPLHLHEISTEDLQKIFPQEYYKKYANHLKILEFEKLIIQEEGRKTSINFKSRHDENEQKRIKSALPKQQLKRIKISKYDTFQDAINKNKEQLKRMAQYNTTLALKLKLSPQKRNVIRSPMRNTSQIEDSIIMKMIAAQEIQFERAQKKNKQLKCLLEKQSSCKFIKKSKSSHATPRKINLFDMDRNNPESRAKTQRKIIENLGDIAKKSIEKNQSFIKDRNNQSKVFDSNASFYIQNINTAIKKSHNILKKARINYKQEDKIVKVMRKRVMSNTIGLQQKIKQKRNLVQQTKKIKEHVYSMATLKQYDIILQKKMAKQNLKNL